jgi:phage baseplate assembly protein W
MASSFGYVLSTSVSAVSAGTASRPYAGKGAHPFLGFGLITPFQRDQKRDFAAAGGERLVKSCVSQLLGMDATDDAGNVGELPWRPELGTWMYKLKHHLNNEVLDHIARAYVAEALARWEPRVVMKEVTTSKRKSVSEDDTMILHMRYDVIASNVPGNQVILSDVDHSIEVT